MKDATRAWLEFAHRDLEAAKALAGNPYLANVVLFHAQQCIEKCLKAVMEERGAEVPRIHSVAKLLSLSITHGFKRISIPDEELELIDAIYIDARYPGGLGTLPSRFPTKEDAKGVLDIAERVYNEVTRSFPSVPSCVVEASSGEGTQVQEREGEYSKSEARNTTSEEKNSKSEARNTKQAPITGKARSRLYDLEDRTLAFAREVRVFVAKLNKSVANIEDGRQLIKASGSVGANYIEANESFSKKDFVLRIKICRKEAKEARYWLNLIDTGGVRETESKGMVLVKEASELMNIFGAILRNSTR